MNHNRFCRIVVSLFLMLTLLLSAFVPALAENVLVPVPAEEVILPEETEAPEDAGTSVLYLPLAYQLPDRSEFISDAVLYTLPRLTNEELERTRVLMEDLKAGKDLVWEDLHCANKAEDVTVGVYALDPEDFNGETFYVILPGIPLTDDMLLSMMKAFDELGIPFDPDSLNERNCQRGNRYDGCTRGLSSEENERMETILHQVRRGIFDPAKIPEGTYCRFADSTGQFQNDGRTYFDPFRFCFYPYRQMTDEELAAFALVTDGAWEIDPDLLQKQALDYVRGLLKVPLSMYVDREYRDPYIQSLTVYYTQLRIPYADEATGREAYPDGKPFQLTVTQEQVPGEEQAVPDSILVFYYMPDMPENPEFPVRSDEEWNSIARAWAEENLRIPKEEIPENWEKDWINDDSQYIQLSMKSGNMYIHLILNRWDGSANSLILHHEYNEI